MEEMTLTAAVLLFAVASTGRPVSTAPVTRVQQVTACAAATRQEVQRALGSTVDIGKLRPDAGGSSCEYSGETGQVSIGLRHAAAALDFNAEIVNLKAVLPEARLVEVPMAGVRALLVDLGEAGAQLHILRNGRDYLLVSVLGFGNATEARAMAEYIAQRALTRF
jgi:hypothetical protein